MSILCPNCLHELKNNEKICPVCHFKIKKKKKFKKPVTILAIIAAFIVILGGGYFLLNNNASEQETTEKFEQAIADRDWRQVKKLVVHHDLSKISTAEAQALVDLVKSKGEVDLIKLFKVQQIDSLFKSYKYIAPKVSLLNNNKNFDYSIKDADITNLVPGHYTINATILPDIAPIKKELRSILVDEQTILYTEVNTEYEEIPFGTSNILPHASININERDFSLASLILRSPLPISVTESLRDEISLTIKYPWETQVEKLSTVKNTLYNFGYPFVVTNKQFTEISNTIETAYRDVLAKKDSKDPTISPNLRKNMPQVTLDKKLYKTPKDITIPLVTNDENNNLNGILASFNFNEENLGYAYLTYDVASKQFILEDLSLENDLSAYDLEKYFTPNVALYTDEELGAYFYTLYIQSVAFDTDSGDMDERPNSENEMQTLFFEKVERKSANEVLLFTSYQKNDEQLVHQKITYKKGDVYWAIAAEETLQ